MPTYRLFVTHDDGSVLEFDVVSWHLHESGTWLCYVTPQGEHKCRSTWNVQEIRAICIDGSATTTTG